MADLEKGLIGHWTMNSEDVDSGNFRNSRTYFLISDTV